MHKKSLRTTQAILFAFAILFFFGCSKNTIILEYGGDDDNGSGGNVPSGQSLVTFNATIEGRNLLTRAMSPMPTGIQNQLFAFQSAVGNAASGTPSAQGLYITISPGVLSGNDGYKMYLTNGIYNFYAVSDNFSTIPPRFTNGKSEPLFNGIDYLWWHNSQLDVINPHLSIPIVYLHAATQVVVEISSGESLKVNKLISAMITPPAPGASMDLTTGTITPATTYDRADKMGVNGLLAQYIMLPMKSSEPMTMTFEVMVNGESNSRTYTVEVPLPSGELKAGDSYLFSAVVNENTVSFPSVSIKNWTEVDETGKPLYPTQTKN